ncbi:unannotated protein [freshwater metagenome]|uniref:Unannotated protein n=1 Tax=freshwater metagenome TaxID=449393 RepID=A0A6J7HPR3_9ZZZZ
MALAHDEAVAFVPARIGRIDVQDCTVEGGEDVCDGEVATDMSEAGSMNRAQDGHANASGQFVDLLGAEVHGTPRGRWSLLRCCGKQLRCRH